MKFRFQKTIGKTVFTFEDECDSHAEFFEKVSFFSAMPEVGPNGEDDLIIEHRTPKGHDYYQITSPSANMEFKFGLKKDDKGSLFPKGWEKSQYAAKRVETDTSKMKEVKFKDDPAPTDDDMPVDGESIPF